MRPRVALLLSTALLAPAVLWSCGSNPDLRPTLILVSPLDGSTNNSTSVQVQVQITGLTLTNVVYPIGDTSYSQPFFGHWELYVDGQPVNGAAQPGAPPPAAAFPPGANQLGDEFGTSVLVLGLSSGQHLIEAILVDQNHSPILGTPPVAALITVPAGVPALSVVSPASGATNASSSVQLGLQVSNFVLDSAAVGGPNVSGEGHYRVFLDGIGPGGDLGEDWSLTPTVSRLPVSASATSNLTLAVALVNNDETPLSPPVVSLLGLTLPAGAPGITLLQPARGATLGTSFNVQVAVTDFTLESWVTNTADTAGAGHWTVLVDGTALASSFSTTASGLAIGHGAHRVQVELRGNVGDELSPPVVDFARVSVP